MDESTEWPKQLRQTYDNFSWPNLLTNLSFINVDGLVIIEVHIHVHKSCPSQVASVHKLEIQCIHLAKVSNMLCILNKSLLTFREVQDHVEDQEMLVRLALR